jgi:hypothetical protein
MIRRGCETTLWITMWTPTTRRQHSRTTRRYQTDLTDAECLLIESHLPAPIFGVVA